MTDLEMKPLGDRAVTISFGKSITGEIHRKISKFIDGLQFASIPGIIEWVPAYTTVAVYYRPEIISYQKVCDELLLIPTGTDRPVETVIYKVPVFYNGEDLPFVAGASGLKEEEVIALHSGTEYLIHLMGFMPGFPYLGGLPDKLSTPRLDTPRAKVAAGAVGIGGSQTGIYPRESPSGWRIIGHTPLKLFDLNRKEPFLFTPGSYIKFSPIESEEYLHIKESVEKGTCKIETVKRAGRTSADWPIR